MKKTFGWLMSILLMGLLALFPATSALAGDKEKDEDRLKNCGTVLKEILDIPDDVPKDLLDKADCDGRFSASPQSRVRGWWKLWPWCDDVPPGERF